ncbi:hypothetical protein QR680_006375 [Steinernema hermaphroditum]|uniref:FLYWCH-type domain-containing protein n=1 Tax=Steinernema hermaphroditum TaxID=289476 RepID=A0AA39HVC5_9BILA|nr:hypothetical protein QR680_006375 [Steinernema hermaphroditum]
MDSWSAFEPPENKACLNLFSLHKYSLSNKTVFVIPSERNGHVLFFDCQFYTRDKWYEKTGRSTWKCCKRKSCKGRIAVQDGKIEFNGEHGCGTDHIEVLAEFLKKILVANAALFSREDLNQIQREFEEETLKNPMKWTSNKKSLNTESNAGLFREACMCIVASVNLTTTELVIALKKAIFENQSLKITMNNKKRKARKEAEEKEDQQRDPPCNFNFEDLEELPSQDVYNVDLNEARVRAERCIETLFLRVCRVLYDVFFPRNNADTPAGLSLHILHPSSIFAQESLAHLPSASWISVDSSYSHPVRVQATVSDETGCQVTSGCEILSSDMTSGLSQSRPVYPFNSYSSMPECSGMSTGASFAESESSGGFDRNRMGVSQEGTKRLCHVPFPPIETFLPPRR